MSRVIGYVDGYNLYHGLKEAGFRKYFWLNIQALIGCHLKPGQTLVETKYFTSRVAYPPATVRRQSAYIDAVKTLADVLVVEGRYEPDYFSCRHCQGSITRHCEKMTDVNIAIAMATDAFADAFDTAILITGDSDQVPTVQLVQSVWNEKHTERKRVICLFPPNRVSQHLRSVAGSRHITEDDLSKSQFPDLVVKSPNEFPLTRPAEWSETPATGQANPT